MKITHLNTTDKGGAFIASFRFHDKLLQQGIDSKYLVLHKFNTDSNVHSYFDIQRPWIQKIKQRIHHKIIQRKKRLFSAQIPNRFISLPLSAYSPNDFSLISDSDIVHLNWVANFIDYNTFFDKVSQPIVWTLHDCNPFLGFFHYDTHDRLTQDIYKVDQRFQKLKLDTFKKNNRIHFIAPSNYMLNVAVENGIPQGQITMIHNGIECPIIKKHEQVGASQKRNLKLPIDKLIVLFVAQNIDDPRKGFNVFQNIMNQLNSNNFHFLVVGDGKQLVDIPNSTRIRHIDDNQLVDIYKASDVLVIPSLLDNLPNVVLESMMYGTVTCAFNTGGLSDLVANNENGFIFKLGDVQSLVEKLIWLEENRLALNNMKEKSVIIGKEKFNIDEQASQYIQLYNSIL